MAWVRADTPQDAVFAHWWDYGYWVQTLGERATMLDGGNSIVYWNYLMGRYALTGTDDKQAIDLLYAHNVTHYLIDSTDIGKYSAFSSIGSDANYDRRSFISTLVMNDAQTQEKKSSTIFVYSGGFGLDGDIIYELNGSRIFLPEGQAGLAGVLIERDSSGVLVQNPIGVFIYQSKQYNIPFRYAHDKGRLIDFGTGYGAGVFLMPRVVTSQTSTQLQQDGAMLYLSPKTVMSQVARLYLYGENNPYFKLAHVEDDFVVAELKKQNSSIGDFVYYGGFRGPIKIWSVSYPSGEKVNPEYLRTTYPDVALTRL
jgi:asparagine N-glycosylation enzyme membrane subunit Stt3